MPPLTTATPYPSRSVVARRLPAMLLVALLVVGGSLAAVTTTAAATAQATDAERPATTAHLAADEDAVELLYFGADGCPYCAQMEVFLDDLEARMGPALRVERFEVSNDPAGRQRWVEELRARGVEPQGVPSTVLDERVWVGFDQSTAAEITAAVEAAVEARRTEAEAEDDADQLGGRGGDGEVDRLEVPLLGEVELTQRSAIGVTALIAFVDGFNPCSLWVLTVLLAMVLNVGATRRRVVAVGLTFLTVTALLYGAFILGLFTVLGLIDQIGAIRVVVAVVALVAGLVNVKDHFAFGRGLSLTIPDRFKPRIYRGGRAVRDRRRSLLSVLATTVVLAAGVALVELPCTAGFPVIWTGTLRSMGVEGGATFAALLALYLVIYVGLELLLFGVVVVTLRMASFEERHGRVLKLVGGSLMLALGVVMLTAPGLLDDLTGLLTIIVAAALLAGVLAAAGRLWHGDDAARLRRTARGR